MFNSLFNLGKDIAETVAAPIEIAADLARTATKPVAEMAKETAKTVKEITAQNDKENT